MLLLSFTPPASAAILRPFTDLASATVHLSDLFDGLGTATDRVLGPAPAPGDRIVVEALQLSAIAREFGVDWRPQSAADRAVLERPGVPLARDAVLAELRPALSGAGAPADAEIALAADLPLVPQSEPVTLAVSQISYDAAGGRFTALLSVGGAGMQMQHLRLAGDVTAMIEAATLVHRLPPGTVLAAADIAPLRIAARLVRGREPVGIAAAIGQALRHDQAAGAPLTAADLARPVLVSRGAEVRMVLEGAGIAVSAAGQALEAGGLGDRVRVMNPASRAIVEAEITGPSEVRVDPDRPPLVRPEGLAVPVSLAAAP